MKHVLCLILGSMCATALSGEGLAIATAIPPAMREFSDASGEIENLSYQSHHYTDSSEMGVQIQPEYDQKGYQLPRREEGLERNCNVYLPFNYDKSHCYPVVYLLHGLGDNENAFLHPGFIPNIFDQLIASGEVEPFIAVFPNGNSSSSFPDRSFNNQAGYYFFGNELTQDLIPFIESRYNVRRDRDGRAICGFSMGGMQTINIGLCQYLDWFSRFGVFAGAPTSYPAQKVASLVRSQPAREIKLLYAICGKQDNVAGQSHRTALANLPRFLPELDANHFAYQQENGGHEWNIAFLGMYNFLRLSFGQSRG